MRAARTLLIDCLYCRCVLWFLGRPGSRLGHQFSSDLGQEIVGDLFFSERFAQ
jgi:hypothetical protein